MSNWSQKGCPICRRQWESGQFPPRLAVSVVLHASLHRCPACYALWEQSERFADVISVAEARGRYPDTDIVDG